MLLYYGANRMIESVSLYTIDFKNEDSENRIADLLKSRHQTPTPYMYFEFKEGYDCRSAQSYLTGKGINKMAFGSCLDVSFKENPEGKYVQPGGLRYWENPDNVTETRVMQLDTWGWALVNKILEKRQEELEKNGWQRVYAEYNLAGGPDDNRWVGKRISGSPDSMYMAIATVMKSSFKLKAIIGDKVDADGNPEFAFEQDFAGDALAETTPFRPKMQLSRLIFAGVSNDHVNTNNAGILIYRKKYSKQDEPKAAKTNKRTIAELGGKISHAAFSNDGKQFVVSSSGDANSGQIKIFDADSEAEVKDIPEMNAHFSIFAPDNKSLYSHIVGKGLVQIDIATGKIFRTLMKDTVGKVLFVAEISPDGKTLAAGTYFGDILLYDLPTGKRTAILTANPSNRLVLRTRFLDNNTLVSAGGDLVKTWNLKTGKEIVTISPPGGEKKMTVDIAAAAKKVFCSYQNNMYVFDALTGKQLSTFDLGNFYSAHFQNNGELVLCSSSEGIYAFNGELKCDPSSNGQRFPHQMEMMISNANKTKVVLAGSNKVMITDYSYFENMTGVKNGESPKAVVDPAPAKTEPVTQAPEVAQKSVPFLDASKTYVFKNWNWAKITFKWNWLETPANDANVTRDFLDLSDKTGDKDDVILRIRQKIDGYTWAMATPNVGKFDTYTYAAILGMASSGSGEFGQGLMILYKDGKKGDYSRLYFLIDPVTATYWFGSQNPNNNKWETHNHYTGTTYNIQSPKINKFVNDGKSIARNTLAIEKQSDRFLLYINGSLVDTVILDKKNEALSNFEGIGIVTVGRQTSMVEKLSFAK
ncbi:MAG: hypothetical protein U0V75_02985 [Ferruginibacter sp.]